MRDLDHIGHSILKCLKIILTHTASLTNMYRGKCKALHILLVLHLSLTTVGVATRPDACFCGQACGHSLYDRMETQRDVPNHNRCLGYECKTCNIERIMNFDPDNLHTTSYGKTVCERWQIPIISNVTLVANYTTNRMDLTYFLIPVCRSAIYLQSLSLLL